MATLRNRWFLAIAMVVTSVLLTLSLGATTALASEQATSTNATPSPTATELADNQASLPVYRLLNHYSGEHHFTTSLAEANNLTAMGGWLYEGIAWAAPTTSGTPVYRVYNPSNGDHHYTTDLNEYNVLKTAGWNQEGLAWYSDDARGKAVYRLYNPQQMNAGSHHYTTDPNEYWSLPAYGWSQENILCYGLATVGTYPEPNPGFVPEPPDSGSTGGNDNPQVNPNNPSTPNVEPYYWINTNSHKIHGDSCSSFSSANLNASHWRKVMSASEAAGYLSRGYTKCRVCNPVGI